MTPGISLARPTPSIEAVRGKYSAVRPPVEKKHEVDRWKKLRKKESSDKCIRIRSLIGYHGRVGSTRGCRRLKRVMAARRWQPNGFGEVDGTRGAPHTWDGEDSPLSYTTRIMSGE